MIVTHPDSFRTETMTQSSRLLEGVGVSKGTGTKCPLLRRFKVISISQKSTTVVDDELELPLPIL